MGAGDLPPDSTSGAAQNSHIEWQMVPIFSSPRSIRPTASRRNSTAGAVLGLPSTGCSWYRSRSIAYPPMRMSAR